MEPPAPKTSIRSHSFKLLKDTKTLTSIYFESESTKIICKVIVDISKDPLLSIRRNSKAKVSVQRTDGTETNMAVVNKLENVLSYLIPVEAFEKMVVEIRFEVLSIDGHLLDYLINLAHYSLLQARIELKDTIASATCVMLTDGQLVIDPTEEELSKTQAKVHIVYLIQKDKLLDFEIEGQVKEEFLKQGLSLVLSGCKALSKKILSSLIDQES